MIDALRKWLSSEEWVPARRLIQRDIAEWDALDAGGALRFGTMEQHHLSGRKLYIDGHRQYRFGSGALVSHRLCGEDGQVACNMIVASTETDQAYLALSRQLNEREIMFLFSDEERAKLPNLTDVTRLYVRERTPGVSEWLTMQYRQQIAGMIGEKMLENGQVRSFRYTLFVNEEFGKALEIECHDDLGYDVYATIYRPLSDIVQMTNEQSAFMKKRAATARQAVADNRQEETLERARTAVKAAADENRKSGNRAAPAEAEAESGADVYDMKGRKADMVILPRVLSEDENAERGNGKEDLTCDIRVAAKIIDEALRNEVPLSDVVRRILGLPITVEDTVRFHLPLTAQDYVRLGARYGIDPSDQVAIRALIVEDLVDFTGERSKTSPRLVQG